MYNKILVPLDGSLFAEVALAHARTLSQCTGAEIALLSVATHPLYEFVSPDPMAYQSIQEESEAESATYLERIADDLHASGLRATAETCTGPVAETILEYAQEIQADLIVMSTHGRSGLARWFIGSVADKVVRGATLPVFLVRPTSA